MVRYLRSFDDLYCDRSSSGNRSSASKHDTCLGSHELVVRISIRYQTATTEGNGSSLPLIRQSDSAARRFMAHAYVADHVSGHELSYVLFDAQIRLMMIVANVWRWHSSYSCSVVQASKMCDVKFRVDWTRCSPVNVSTNDNAPKFASTSILTTSHRSPMRQMPHGSLLPANKKTICFVQAGQRRIDPAWYAFWTLQASNTVSGHEGGAEGPPSFGCLDTEFSHQRDFQQALSYITDRDRGGVHASAETNKPRGQSSATQNC